VNAVRSTQPRRRRPPEAHRSAQGQTGRQSEAGWASQSSHSQAATGELGLPFAKRHHAPAIAEPHVRRHILACRVLGDVGALLLGLMVAQGIQRTVMALGGPIHPLRPVVVSNVLAILVWLALFANAGLYDSRRLVIAADEFKLV
jgi:hypothetical protein